MIAFVLAIIQVLALSISASLFMAEGLAGLVGEGRLPIKTRRGYVGLFVLGVLLFLPWVF